MRTQSDSEGSDNRLMRLGAHKPCVACCSVSRILETLASEGQMYAAGSSDYYKTT